VTPELWRQVEVVFQAALECDPLERAAFVKTACAEDAALRQEVISLLEANEGGAHFLEVPAFRASSRAGAGGPYGVARSRAAAAIAERLGLALADRYRIQRELGHGGMATVYLAQDLRHERLVALKVLEPHVAELLGAARFVREIKLAARLHHPHLLPVYDSGEAGDLLYYVVPYVEGGSLRDRLQSDGRLPLGLALRLVHEAADGLDYAHRHGIVHRDVKPENILLEDQHAVVADFGIARAIDAATSSHLTQPGLVVGSPAYMSPEQANAEPVDGRSDVYSLACVLFECLTGTPPFTGASLLAILTGRFMGPVPSLRATGIIVPAEVEEAVTRALATHPANRFLSAAAFADVLAGAAADIPRSGTKRRE
jgi:eukaryotic-like serine/threonine-protein kinase